MNHLASSRPRPVPTADSKPFWEGLEQHELLIPYCRRCERLFFPPAPRCRRCWSTDISWRPSVGIGTLRSFCVVYVAFVPGIETPYTVLEVGLDDQEDLVLESMPIGADANDLRIGQKMGVRFATLDGFTLHGFAPIVAAATG